MSQPVERLDKYQHVGKKLVGFDFNFSLSPMVRAIIAADADENAIAKSIADAIHAAVAERLEHWQWSMEAGKVNVYFCHPIKTELEETAEDEANMKALRESFQASDKARAAQLAADPNNGTLGYWRVDGVRHEAIVRASSAPEAVAKAEESGSVGDWESPTAEFIGVEMPEVV